MYSITSKVLTVQSSQEERSQNSGHERMLKDEQEFTNQRRIGKELLRRNQLHQKHRGRKRTVCPGDREV